MERYTDGREENDSTFEHERAGGPSNTFCRATSAARSLVGGDSAIVEYDRVRFDVVIPRLRGGWYGTLCVMKRCLVYTTICCTVSFLAGKGLSYRLLSVLHTPVLP